MKYLVSLVIVLLFVGCGGVKKGDYVVYTSNKFLFIEDTFINKNLYCLELGAFEEGGLDVKYCVGRNYASALVQGFMFEHDYDDNDERYLGATLTFQGKKTYKISCTSETVDASSSGTEYINCMTAQRDFDMYRFIMLSKKDISGQFKAAVGNNHVYKGVINKEGKQRLKKFYKALEDTEDKKWINRSL